MNKIEFSLENYEKCKCVKCPVQVCNTCVLEKHKEIEPKIAEKKIIPDPIAVPGMYCATGKSTFGDLDTKQICQCFLCPLWTEYDLLHGEPMKYFCRDGAGKEKK